MGIINRRGGCTVRERASHFDVTEVTIRRELKSSKIWRCSSEPTAARLAS